MQGTKKKKLLPLLFLHAKITISFQCRHKSSRYLPLMLNFMPNAYRDDGLDLF